MIAHGMTLFTRIGGIDLTAVSVLAIAVMVLGYPDIEVEGVFLSCQAGTFERQMPMKRMAHVDAMVGLAVFPLSDAASFATG